MRRLIIPSLLVLAMSACDGNAESSVSPPTDTPDGDWVMIEGMDTVPGFPITLSIDGAAASGRAACNSYFGTVSVAGTTVSFAEMGQTLMGCEPAVQEAETTFLTALMTVDGFTRNGDRLTLFGPGVDLRFDQVVPTPTSDLVGTDWVLDTLIEGNAASSVSGDPATLLLQSDGTLTASTGCRTLTGRWIDNAGVIVVPELSADGQCSDELSKQDSLVVTVIGDEFRAEVNGDTLTLTSMGGDGLGYRART